jgi:ElaB/YqjD/DUF883 family membrane-anchored ribosome-binding protein
VTNGELKADFRVVCDSAEDLLKATADLGGEKLIALRQRVDQALRNVRTQVSETQDKVINRARQDAMAANAFVHENPWKTVGIAAGVGLLVGLLVSRRSMA